jgi:hypothetical protein
MKNKMPVLYILEIDSLKVNSVELHVFFAIFHKK